ncbi:uncharacterized protein LOC136082928 [Hydra vulgaris]|uniref:Uncharacterized protein LOC136082928 n=1 Tax=Hydra vulgaris TaxID=6087 RepID=A0ABM4C9R5_HYDVU
MFVKSKERLIKKFNILQSEHANGKDIARKTTKYKKDAVLNLCDTDISISHNDFLNLGPNFVPSLKSIPYMDIITTTESSALKLEYNNKVKNAQNLRKNVLRILKTEKKINNNLTKEQRISFREIKNDETIAIYPFDKGTGFCKEEYEKIYPSDPIPSIPLKEATVILLKQLSNNLSYKNLTKLSIPEIKQLIELCLYQCYFHWNNKIHVMENSGPIGLSFMVVLAESFLQFHENYAIKMALTQNPALNLKSFLRYVDDSHARFPNIKQAKQFQDILNQQHPAIQYTIEVENEIITLNFLDITITNNTLGKYEYKVYRKEAITNIQIKPHSNHDPNILTAIFKGFLHRAYSICSKHHLQNEINFLTDMFIENGYDEKLLRNITHQFHQKRQNKNKIPSECNNLPVVSLPWVPGLSPKLRKIFRKAGYRAVFKSNPNLRSLLTSKNKTKLPSNSQPGTYIIKCNCSKVYIGETKMQVSTRMHQHQKSINENKPNQSALAYHKTFCKENIIWEKTRTLKVENKKFENKIREALEIQNNMCSARNGGINLDEGQYVKTMFWTPFLKFKNQKKPFNR